MSREVEVEVKVECQEFTENWVSRGTHGRMLNPGL